jgi:FtsP/CotA-like multicopper oxidase with cupredoxin domain
MAPPRTRRRPRSQPTDFSHPFLGDQVYMVHCHNLEHEDGGMMLNLEMAA